MPTVVSGFAGSVDQVEDALRSPFQGNILPVVLRSDSLAVSPNLSGTRSVNIAAGTSWAHGVRAAFDATAMTFDAVTVLNQTRWDAVIVRRDWNAGTAVLTKVVGVPAVGAPKVLPAGVRNEPGQVHDQVLALVQITYNVGTVVVEDRRMLAHKTTWAPSVAALPPADRALFGMEALVGDAGTRYRCGLNSSGVPAWLSQGSGWLWATEGDVVSMGQGGFSGTNMGNQGGYNPTTGDVQLDLRFRRAGATVTPNATGNFSPDLPFGIIREAYRPSTYKPIEVQYRAASGAWYQGGGIFGADGLLTIFSGTAGVPLATWPDATQSSLRTFIRFTREV